jgi:hypothetical protein
MSMSAGAGIGGSMAAGAAAGSIIPGWGTAIGAVVGAGIGLLQNEQRKKAARFADLQAGLMYDHAVKAKRANEAILEGQLTVGAMQNTSQSREAAIQVAQQEGMREAALASTGTIGGTPFYALDLEVQQNSQRLSELLTSQRIDYGGKVAQAQVQMDSYDMQIQNAVWGYQQASEQLAYVESPVAMALAIGTGALSGAATANNINTAVTQMTGTDIEGHMGGWFAKKPQATMTQGGYLPQLNDPVYSSSGYLPQLGTPSSQGGYLPQLGTPSSQGGYLPQLGNPSNPWITPGHINVPSQIPSSMRNSGSMNFGGSMVGSVGYIDFMGMGSAKGKGVNSNGPLGKPLLQY